MMDEQRLCNECGRFSSLYHTEPRYVGGHGYLEWITCIRCMEKTERESEAAVADLRRKVKMGKLDTIRTLFEEYASNPALYNSTFFAHEVYNLCTGKESE